MNEYRWYDPRYTLPLCQPQGNSSPCPDTAWWFWLAAAALLLTGGKK